MGLELELGLGVGVGLGLGLGVGLAPVAARGRVLLTIVREHVRQHQRVGETVRHLPRPGSRARTMCVQPMQAAAVGGPWAKVWAGLRGARCGCSVHLGAPRVHLGASGCYLGC